MLFFGPRIRKKEMGSDGGTRRKQIFHCVQRLQAQDPQVSENMPFSSVASAAHPTRQPFDPEKIALRKFLRHRDEKRPVAAA